MENKGSRLKKVLSNADVVNIEVINSRIVDGKSGSEIIRLISGIPENDAIIEKLRNAL